MFTSRTRGRYDENDLMLQGKIFNFLFPGDMKGEKNEEIVARYSHFMMTDDTKVFRSGPQYKGFTREPWRRPERKLLDVIEPDAK